MSRYVPPPVNYVRYEPSNARRDRPTVEDEFYRDRRREDGYDYERIRDRRAEYDEIDLNYYPVRPAPGAAYHNIGPTGRTVLPDRPDISERRQGVIHNAGGIRPAPTLPIHFDDYPGMYRPHAEGPVLREREAEPYTTRARYARAESYGSSSPSPVRVRERVIELSRPIASGYRWRSRSPSPPLGGAIRSRVGTIRGRRRDISPVASEYGESGPDAFKLSRHVREPLIRGASGSSSDDYQLASTLVAHPPMIGIQGRTTLNVSNSQYTGDGSIGGFHSADLNVLDDTNHNDKKMLSQSVFRWIQFDDLSMSFERFQSVCQTTADLTDAQKRAMTRLFSRIRRDFDKSMQTTGGTMVGNMLPSMINEPVPQDSNEKRSKSRNITWMCLPYFTLQKYSGNHSSLPSSSHPMRTLLQARFSLTRKDRDMQQAVRQLKSTPSEHCFHIAQAWHILIDDAVLITCTRSPLPSLMGKTISVVSNGPGTTGDVYHPTSPSSLLVTHGSILWSLPLDECQSWFAFMSHFWECWPKSIHFLYEDKIITPEEWPKLIARAKKTFLQLSLETSFNMPKLPLVLSGTFLHAEPSESSDVGSTLQPDKPTTAPQASTKEVKVEVDKIFQVFTWLNEESIDDLPDTGTFSSGQRGSGSIEGQLQFDEKGVKADLAESEAFLQKLEFDEGRSLDAGNYEGISCRTRRDVYMLLRMEKSRILQREADAKERADREDAHPRVRILRNTPRQVYDQQVDILNKAENLFRFFLPAELQGPTVDRFWGGLYRVLEGMSPSEIEGSKDLDDGGSQSSRESTLNGDKLARWLSDMLTVTQSFRDILSFANREERSKIEIPWEFATAWIYFLACLLPYPDRRPEEFDKHSRTCDRLLTQGMRKVVRELHSKSLADYCVLKPLGLVSLINLVLVGDVTPPQSDTSETYLTYFRQLVSDVETNPLDRGHQDKIVRFHQEIDSILETLRQQRSILASSQDSLIAATEIVARPRESNPFSPTYGRQAQRRGGHERMPRIETPVYFVQDEEFPGAERDFRGVHNLLTQDAKSLVDRKIRDFRQMSVQASELQTWNINRIESNKDRQEAAIYAFTIVTIVFLPLSAVAGILGMNVSDIRDMGQKQWVFWVTALPLTGIIIFLCLAWAGELENLWRSLKSFWPQTLQRQAPRLDPREQDPYSRLAPRENHYIVPQKAYYEDPGVRPVRYRR